MYKFGAAPREFESFGVSGLLGKESHVYHETLFSTKHLGKISDLVLARIRSASLDELKLRSMILYVLHEAWLVAVEGAADKQGALPEPLTFECGIDGEKAAIGVSFTAPEGMKLTWDGVPDRVVGRKPGNALEQCLTYLHDHCHRLVLRQQAATRRYEVVAVIGFEGKVPAAEMSGPCQIVTTSFGKDGQVKEAPKPASYVELGDLDFTQLLADEVAVPGRKKRSVQRTTTGDFVYQELTAEEIKGMAEDPSRMHKVLAREGDEADDPRPDQVIAADKQANDQNNILVKSSSEEAADLLVVKGSRTDQANDLAVKSIDELTQEDISNNPLLRQYYERIQQMSVRLKQLEDENLQLAHDKATSSRAAPDAEDATEAEHAGEDSGMGGILKKVWPFKKKEGESTESEGYGDGGPKKPIEEKPGYGDGGPKKPIEEKPGYGTGPAAGEGQPQSADGLAELGIEPLPAAEAPELERAPSSADEIVIEGAVNDLLNELKSGSFQLMVLKLVKEYPDVRKVLGNNGAAPWMDSVIRDLEREKERMGQLAVKLSDSVKQSELDFRQKEVALKNKERTYQTEIRNREREIRHKDYALSRVKEVLAQTTANLEKLKSAGPAQVEAAQNQGNKKGASHNEVMALQTKLDRAQKQLDDLKKSNQQLADKMNELRKEKDSSSASSGDLRKKLDASTKMLSLAKKQADHLAAQVETLRKEEGRLKSEALKMQAELQTLKGAKKPGGGKPGTGAPPAKGAA